MSLRSMTAMVAAALCLAAAPATTLHAQAKPAAKPASTPKATAKTSAKTTDSLRADAAFIHEASADNELEVRLGQVAGRRSKNADVKSFAERMVTDHTRLEQDLTAMASKHGMTERPMLGRKHEAKLDKLQKTSDKEFDRSYMRSMIEDHMDDVSYFEQKGRSAHTSEVRDLVNAALPTLREHLTLAKQVAGKVGVDTAAVARTRHVASTK